MQRIVKRFLLHKQRESDEVGEADFDELKQDLQMVRFEMVNDLKKSREETYRLINHLSSGLLLIGDEIFKESKSDNSRKYKEFRNTDSDFYHEFNHDPLPVIDESKQDQKYSLYYGKDNSISLDSGLHSIKESNSLMFTKSALDINKQNEAKNEKKPISSIESMGSSTDTQSSNEQITDTIQINSSPNSETEITNGNVLNNPPIIDLLDNQKLKGLSLSELQAIDEEDEIIYDSSLERCQKMQSANQTNDKQVTINLKNIRQEVVRHKNEDQYLF